MFSLPSVVSSLHPRGSSLFLLHDFWLYYISTLLSSINSLILWLYFFLILHYQLPFSFTVFSPSFIIITSSFALLSVTPLSASILLLHIHSLTPAPYLSTLHSTSTFELHISLRIIPDLIPRTTQSSTLLNLNLPLSLSSPSHLASPLIAGPPAVFITGRILFSLCLST